TQPGSYSKSIIIGLRDDSYISYLRDGGGRNVAYWTCVTISYSLSSLSLSRLHEIRRFRIQIAVIDLLRRASLFSEEEGDANEGGGDFPEPPEEAKLFVGNLAYDVDSQALATLFEQAGTVEIAEVNKSCTQPGSNSKSIIIGLRDDSYISYLRDGGGRNVAYWTRVTISYSLSSLSLSRLHEIRRFRIQIAVIDLLRRASLFSEEEGDANEGGGDFPEPPEEAKLFVRNLAYDVDSQALAMLFEQAGTVEIAEVNKSCVCSVIQIPNDTSSVQSSAPSSSSSISIFFLSTEHSRDPASDPSVLQSVSNSARDSTDPASDPSVLQSELGVSVTSDCVFNPIYASMDRVRSPSSITNLIPKGPGFVIHPDIYVKDIFLACKKKYSISCPLQGCQAEVEWDAIENLTVRKKNRYDEYVLRSYLKKSKKQITIGEKQETNHLEKEQRLKEVQRFLERNQHEALSSLPITIGDFLWFRIRLVRVLCQLQSKESHETESGTYGDCVEPVTEQDALEKGAEVVDTSCLDRWEACKACQELLRDFKGGKKKGLV
ncbi:unnamed protein product, partial [Brassica oleracea]